MDIEFSHCFHLSHVPKFVPIQGTKGDKLFRIPMGVDFYNRFSFVPIYLMVTDREN